MSVKMLSLGRPYLVSSKIYAVDYLLKFHKNDADTGCIVYKEERGHGWTFRQCG